MRGTRTYQASNQPAATSQNALNLRPLIVNQRSSETVNDIFKSLEKTLTLPSPTQTRARVP